MINYANSNEEDVKTKRIIASYDRFVPFQILKLLGKEHITQVGLGDQVEKKLTILFSDIRDFTTLSEALTPQENFNFINSYLSQMETLISVSNGIIDKFIGDAVMAIFPTHADDSLDCALLMLKQLIRYNEGRRRAGYVPIKIGIGLNTGICMLGTVGGANRMAGTVISDAVNLSSRLESLTKKYGVQLLISEHTYYSLKDPSRHYIRFIDRVLVKGKNHPQSIYEVYDIDDEEVRQLKLETKPLFDKALAFYHYKYINEAKALLALCLERNPGDMPAKLYMERCDLFLKTGMHESANELQQKLQWSTEFETGYQIIDHQHLELFNNSLVLLQAIGKEDKQDDIDRVVAFLTSYVVDHFRDEENLMRQLEYPFLIHHEELHRKFVESFGILKREIADPKASKTYLMFRIQILLIDWLINHIFKEDKHFSKYVRDKNREVVNYVYNPSVVDRGA